MLQTAMRDFVLFFSYVSLNLKKGQMTLSHIRALHIEQNEYCLVELEC